MKSLSFRLRKRTTIRILGLFFKQGSMMVRMRMSTWRWALVAVPTGWAIGTSRPVLLGEHTFQATAHIRVFISDEVAVIAVDGCSVAFVELAQAGFIFPIGNEGAVGLGIAKRLLHPGVWGLHGTDVAGSGCF